MRKKVLIIATVVKTHICAFHLPYIEMFHKRGYETYVAAKNDCGCGNGVPEIPFCDHFIDIPFSRNPASPQNITAYRRLKKLFRENRFDIVQCNTPIGGALGRLAARKARKSGTRVVYIAHGFHFFKGGSKAAWLLYYPIEKLLSRLTDTLVTINREDYELAAHSFQPKELVLTNGIGVRVNDAIETVCDREAVRRSFGIPLDAKILVSVGELRELKNHKTILHAMGRLTRDDLYYIIVGSGAYREELEHCAKELYLSNRVRLPGFCTNVFEIVKACDIFCFPSLREGLPSALIEAMACGMPVLASDIRGSRDLITPGVGGYLYAPHDTDGFADGIKRLCADPALCARMGNENLLRAKRYDLSVVMPQYEAIYFRDDTAAKETDK